VPRVRLSDGTRIHCLRRFEALALDEHVDGYLRHGIEVGPGSVVFDVGANIGLFALRLLQRLGREVTVVAFEPAPPIFEVLERNVGPVAHDRVFLERRGLSREHGEAELTYFPNGPALSTMHPEVWRDRGEELEAAVRGGARHAPTGMRWGAMLPRRVLAGIARRLVGRAERFDCELTTVSAVMRERGLDSIDLLKVDVEGAELDVLRGIDAADWPRVHQVVTEVHDTGGRLAEVTELLRTHGLTQLVTDQDPAFAGTSLHNVYARRP